jgi:hypothetical protein
MRNLQEQVKKVFCYQNLFWPFTVWINCSNDLKTFANSRPSASNFKSFPRSLEELFLTVVGHNNFGKKIPFFMTDYFICFQTFPVCFWIQIIFSNFNYNCSNVLDLKRLDCTDHTLFQWIILVISKISLELETLFSITRTFFFLAVGQNNFVDKITMLLNQKTKLK